MSYSTLLEVPKFMSLPRNQICFSLSIERHRALQSENHNHRADAEIKKRTLPGREKLQSRETKQQLFLIKVLSFGDLVTFSTLSHRTENANDGQVGIEPTPPPLLPSVRSRSELETSNATTQRNPTRRNPSNHALAC
jgi:hypothetical protein